MKYQLFEVKIAGTIVATAPGKTPSRASARISAVIPFC
jgi:hypothetical protein